MKLTLNEVTDGDVISFIKQWQEALRDTDTVIGDIVFETIDGTITFEGVETKVVGIRRVNHGTYSDIEFLKEDGTILGFKCLIREEELAKFVYTYDDVS